MEIEDVPLETVGISNDAYDDSYFVADNPYQQMSDILFWLPLIILVSFTAVSFGITQKYETKVANFVFAQKPGVDSFSVSSTISKISFIHRAISMNFSLKDPPKDAGINGTANLTFMTTITKSNIIIKENLVLPFNTDDAAAPISLLDDKIINFDTIKTSINFTTEAKENQRYEILVRSMTQSFSFSFYAYQCFLTLLVLSYLGVDLFSLLDINGNDTTIEQQVTYVLSIFVVLYINPLRVLAQSVYLDVLSIFVRDVFFAYLIFYGLTIFSYFGIDVSINHIVRMSFPFFIMIVVCSVLLWFDVQPYVVHFIQYYSLDNVKVNSDLSLVHYAYFMVGTIVMIIRVLVARYSATSSQMKRYYYYSISFIFLVTLLSIAAAVNFVWYDSYTDAFITQVFLWIVFSSYAIFMEFGHEDTIINKHQSYFQANNPTNGEIGIEEDPEQLDKK